MEPLQPSQTPGSPQHQQPEYPAFAWTELEGVKSLSAVWNENKGFRIHSYIAGATIAAVWLIWFFIAIFSDTLMPFWTFVIMLFCWTIGLHLTIVSKPRDWFRFHAILFASWAVAWIWTWTWMSWGYLTNYLPVAPWAVLLAVHHQLKKHWDEGKGVRFWVAHRTLYLGTLCVILPIDTLVTMIVAFSWGLLLAFHYARLNALSWLHTHALVALPGMMLLLVFSTPVPWMFLVVAIWAALLAFHSRKAGHTDLSSLPVFVTPPTFVVLSEPQPQAPTGIPATPVSLYPAATAHQHDLSLSE